MLREYSKIIGNKIVSQEKGQLLGLLKDIIIQPDTGKVEGFWVKPLTIPISDAVMSLSSVLEWKKQIYIKDEGEFAEAGDILKISDILSRNILYIGNRVRSEEGGDLGQVVDLVFDDQKGYVKQIMIEKTALIFAYHKRIFSFESIIEVLPEYILVKDKQAKKISEGVILKKEEPLLDA